MTTFPKNRMRLRWICLRNYLLDGIFSLLPGKAHREERPAVLAVRLDGIGDFVLWLDAAAALRSIYPPEQFRLVLLANRLWSELAAEIPLFDEVLAVDTQRLFLHASYRSEIWRRLRARSWEAAVNPTFSRNFLFDDAAVRVCGAAERIGSQGDCSNQRPWEKRISDRWYTRLVAAGAEPLMELERNAEFVRGLGMPDFRAGLPVLPVSEKADPELQRDGYFVVVPGASLAMKQWPVERFAAVVRKVRERYGLTPVVCGGAGDAELGRRLQRLAPDAVDARHLLCGRTSLAQLARLIRDARLVIGNDSGAIHIAAAVGTPSFCLAGGAHYGRFVPYRLELPATGPLPVAVARAMPCYHCNLHCRYEIPEGKAAPCLDEIPVDDLWEQLRRELDGDR